MKILIVCKYPTHPTVEGNRKFIIEQVELFKRMGHEVHYLYVMECALFKGNNEDKDCLPQMKSYWGDKLYIYKVSKCTKLIFNLVAKYRQLFGNGYEHCDDEFPNGLVKFVNKLNERGQYDCCLVNYYTLSYLLTKIAIPLKGLVTHDYFSYKNLLLNQKKTWMGTSADQEAKGLQRSPHIFALNTEEAVFFSKMSPQSKIYNVFSFYKYHSNKVVGNRDILFLSGRNKFNVNGLNWFLSEIYPKVIAKFPNVNLKIGGGICNVIKHLQNKPNIELVGYVDNAKSFYESADVVINPTYQGTGLKIKTFEGISYDKVVIAHPHSLIGIFAPNNAPVFASKNADEWVAFLERIWQNTIGADEIAAIKKQNEQYLKSMSQFVEVEYRNFFNCL